jgi:hypothetical protein
LSMKPTYYNNNSEELRRETKFEINRA